MRFSVISTIALGFFGFTVGQLETSVSSVNCIDPAFCTTGTPTRSNGYTASITDSIEPILIVTEYRRQDPPSSTCTNITEDRTIITEWATPISTHIQCDSDKATPTCSTSYECGCHSTHFTRDPYPETHLCWPDHTATVSFPDYGGRRSQPGRRVAREPKKTTAPAQMWTRTGSKPIAAQATSQDLGGRSQRRVAREAAPTPVEPCDPSYFGPGCKAREAVAPRCEPGKFGPGCFTIITHAAALEARQEQDTQSICVGDDCTVSFLTPIGTPTATTTSHFGCPSGACGSGCCWGRECDRLFGRGPTQDLGGRSQRRVAREAEATAVAEVVHSTLLTLRA